MHAGDFESLMFRNIIQWKRLRQKTRVDNYAFSIFCYVTALTNLSSPDSDSLFFPADYHPPTPPQKTGFHRYQFMIIEQPPDSPVSLTEREKSARGNDSAHQHLEFTTLLASAASSIIYQHWSTQLPVVCCWISNRKITPKVWNSRPKHFFFKLTTL